MFVLEVSNVISQLFFVALFEQWLNLASNLAIKQREYGEAWRVALSRLNRANRAAHAKALIRKRACKGAAPHDALAHTRTQRPKDTIPNKRNGSCNKRNGHRAKTMAAQHGVLFRWQRVSKICFVLNCDVSKRSAKDTALCTYSVTSETSLECRMFPRNYGTQRSYSSLKLLTSSFCLGTFIKLPS